MDEKKKEFNLLKEKVKDSFENESYKENILKSILNSKHEVRKTYLTLILISPERVGKIMEKTFVVKKTLYNHLYNLISLGLVKKISVLDLIKRKTKLNEDEQEVLEKFKKWTITMGEGMKQLYTAKTNYFALTELGKDESIINWALESEKKMKKGGEIEIK